jgi:hypothetical protein
MSITGLQESVADLEGNVRLIETAFQNQQEILQKLSTANSHVYTYLHTTAVQMQELIAKVGCRAERDIHRVEQLLIRHIVAQEATRLVDRAIDSALNGNISPELIGVKVLQNLLQQEGLEAANVLLHEP